MALDLRQVSAQIDGMAVDLESSLDRRREQIANALVIMHEQGRQFDHLKAKAESSRGKTTWLVAGLKRGLANVYPAPLPPNAYLVIGVDGSQISPDRHNPIQCCLINVGTCLLRYGERPAAQLESTPVLYYRDAELVIQNPANSTESQRLEGQVFSAKREIVAVQHLVDLVRSKEIDLPCLGLLDASLILWSLAGQSVPEYVRARLLGEEFLPCLDWLRNLGSGMALASYVSAPGSADVVNTLRIAICPFDHANCDEFCGQGKGKQCGEVDGVRDRDLFARLLTEAGSRSDVFASQSSVVQKNYGGHEVHFYYVNVGSEIARIEVPCWVAADSALLSLTHSLVLDQVRRGHGYPVALTEAHEKAVITAADRESFWLLVEAELAQRQMHHSISQKRLSKNVRGV